jgi:flagellar biosynthesis/type III secretory pathway chaperone
LPTAPEPSPADRSIEQTLADELGALQHFSTLLAEEQEVLKRGEADKLPPIVDKKSVLAARLGELLAQREHALTTTGQAAGREGMEAWLAKHPRQSAIGPIWQRLLDLAVTARSQQELNGKLIAMQLLHNQQAIAALMSASGRPLTYGPDGHQRMGGGGRTLGSA